MSVSAPKDVRALDDHALVDQEMLTRHGRADDAWRTSVLAELARRRIEVVDAATVAEFHAMAEGLL